MMIPVVYSFIHILYFLRPKQILHSLDHLYNLQSKRLVMMLASLHTQTGLCRLTIQVLNTRVWFLDIWYTSLTSIHNNLKHGLVTVTESFSSLDLDYIISFVKVQIRSDVTGHAIPDTLHLSYATTSKNQFEIVTVSLSHILSMQKIALHNLC